MSAEGFLHSADKRDREYQPPKAEVNADREQEVELLAAEFHAVYQAEARRQGDVRHHDDYEALAENVKKFDRVLARRVIGLLDAERALRQQAEQERDAMQDARFEHYETMIATAEARVARLEQALARAAFVAEHLHGMIPREVWRDSGGDDSQGHYEGDYHAERVAAEIKEWAALGVAETKQEPPR